MISKEDILDRLHINQRKTESLLRSITSVNFNISMPGQKWTIGQNFSFILKNIGPLKSGLGLPKWQLKLIFGKAQQPSRSFEQMRDMYNKRSGEDAKVIRKLIPGKKKQQKTVLAQKLKRSMTLITRLLRGFNENDIDELLLRHPLFGKLTIREMSFLVIYILEYHLEIVEDKLKELPNEAGLHK